MSAARPRFTQRELEALSSALAFITAGEIAEADPDIPREVFESAHEKVAIMRAARARATGQS